MSFLATAGTPGVAQTENPFITFLPIIVIFAIMYLFMILPQRKKEKKTREMINAAVKGDTLTTIGGITGTIVTVKEDTIVFETGSDKTKITVHKWAIRDVVPHVTEEN